MTICTLYYLCINISLQYRDARSTSSEMSAAGNMPRHISAIQEKVHIEDVECDGVQGTVVNCVVTHHVSDVMCVGCSFKLLL